MSEVLLLDQILNLQVPVSEAGDADPSPVVSKVFVFSRDSLVLLSPPRGSCGPSRVSAGSNRTMSKSDTFHWLGGFLTPLLSSSA